MSGGSQYEILHNLYSHFQRVLKHEDDSTLLRAYISEWSKFFTQCNYLPKPFGTLESNLQGKAGGGTSKRPLNDGITVQKVCLWLHTVGYGIWWVFLTCI